MIDTPHPIKELIERRTRDTDAQLRDWLLRRRREIGNPAIWRTATPPHFIHHAPSDAGVHLGATDGRRWGVNRITTLLVWLASRPLNWLGRIVDRSNGRRALSKQNRYTDREVVMTVLGGLTFGVICWAVRRDQGERD